MAPVGVLVEEGKGRGASAEPGSARLVPFSTTNQSFSLIRTVPAGEAPEGVAVDSATDQIFVTNEQGNNITVINGTTGSTIGPGIPTPGDPWGITYDSDNGLLYVADYNHVTIINGSTDVAIENLSVDSNSAGIAFDPLNGDIYVADPGPYGTNDNLSIINGSTNRFIGSGLEVGSYPLGVTVDTENGLVYVANAGSNDVTVINGADNLEVTDLPTGSDPYTPLYDPATGDIYVANSDSDNLTVINGTTDSTVGTGIALPAGTGPWGLAVDPRGGDLFVGGWTSGNLTVVNPATDRVVDPTLSIGSQYGQAVEELAFDNDTGQVYALDSGLNDVAVVQDEEFEVRFTESGLPAGTEFNVTLGPDRNSTTGSTVAFWESAGSYPWSIGPEPGYTTQWTGEVNVSDRSVSVSVVFAPPTYPVEFDQLGIPSSIPWYVNLTTTESGASAPHSGPVLGASTTLELANGTYTWKAQNGWIAEQSTLTGTLEEQGGVSSPPSPILLDWATGNYTVTFEESGLPAGVPWYVNFTSGPAGFALPASGPRLGPSVVLALANGTYSLTIQTGNRSYSTQDGWTLTESGGATSPAQPIVATFVPVTYPVRFGENGLPSGTEWSASIVNGPSNNSTVAELSLDLTNGSYEYRVAAPGYLADPSSGTVSVHGASPPVVWINFSAPTTPKRYTIGFVETGLGNGTSWSVALNGSSRSATGTALSFEVPNGVYGFSVAAIPEYSASPSSGNITVSGMNVTVAVTFHSTVSAPPAATHSNTFLGLPLAEGYGLVGLLAAAAVGAGIAYLLRRRRPKPLAEPPGPD